MSFHEQLGQRRTAFCVWRALCVSTSSMSTGSTSRSAASNGSADFQVGFRIRLLLPAGCLSDFPKPVSEDCHPDDLLDEQQPIKLLFPGQPVAKWPCRPGAFLAGPLCPVLGVHYGPWVPPASMSCATGHRGPWATKPSSYWQTYTPLTQASKCGTASARRRNIRSRSATKQERKGT